MLLDDPAGAGLSHLGVSMDSGASSALEQVESGFTSQEDEPYWAYGPLNIVPRLLSLPPPLGTTVEEQARWHGYMVQWAHRMTDRACSHYSLS